MDVASALTGQDVKKSAPTPTDWMMPVAHCAAIMIASPSTLTTIASTASVARKEATCSI